MLRICNLLKIYLYLTIETFCLSKRYVCLFCCNLQISQRYTTACSQELIHVLADMKHRDLRHFFHVFLLINFVRSIPQKTIMAKSIRDNSSNMHNEQFVFHLIGVINNNLPPDCHVSPCVQERNCVKNTPHNFRS